MFAADREHVLRRHRPHRRSDQPANSVDIADGDRIEDEGEDERGDVGGFAVGRHAEDSREDPVGESGIRRVSSTTEKAIAARVVGHQSEEAEEDRRSDQRQQVVEHQPVRRHAVEQAIDAGQHGRQQASKPLVSVARPLRSTR